MKHKAGDVVSERVYERGKKLYWRKAKVIMDCVTFNRTQPSLGKHRFSATWEGNWPYRMTLREHFPDL